MINIYINNQKNHTFKCNKVNKIFVNLIFNPELLKIK